MNIFGAIGKKSIKAIGGMTKAEIEAAAEAERAAAQASWDRVAGMEPAREKTGLRYSPAIGPELAGKQYAKDTAKFPGMAGFDPYEPRAIFDAQSASGLPVEIIRNPTRDDLLRMTAPSRDPNSASFRGSMSDALARYMTDDKGNRYAFSASDLVHQEAADALRGHGVPLKSYGGEGMAQDDNGVVRRFGDELTPSGVMSAKDLFRWRYGIPAGIGAATGAAVLGSPQDADAMPDAYALKEALTLTLGAGVAGGVYANAPTRRYLKNTPARIRYGMESKMDNAESVTRTIDLPNGAEINFNVGRGAGGLLPKDVTWDIGLPMDSKAEEALKNAYINRYNTAIQYGAEGPEYAKAEAEWDAARSDVKSAMSGAGRKAAVPAFRAAKQALLDDMATRSPFAPWSPESGYSFYGATGKHDKIYESMIRNTKHPDYFPQIKDDRFYLRRKFPYRHEVAAGVGAGALLAPSSAEGGNIPDGAGDFAGDFQPHFIVNPRQEHAAAAPTRSDELNDLIGPAFDKLAGGDYLGAGFALGQGVPEYLKRRQGDPQAVAADAFELWDPTGLASIPLQWWDQNKYNEDVVRRPDFSSDGGGPEVARYKKRAIFAKGRK